MTGEDDQGNVGVVIGFLRFYLDTQENKTSFSTLHVPFSIRDRLSTSAPIPG